MGTLKSTVTLSSSDLNSGTLASTTTKDLTVKEGGILLKEVDVTTEGTAVVLLAQANHTEGTKVYIRNKHASNTVNIKFTAGSTSELKLAANQWAFFPWKAAVDMEVWASAADTIVEYGTFK